MEESKVENKEELRIKKKNGKVGINEKLRQGGLAIKS